MEPEERLTHIKDLSDLPDLYDIAQLPRSINWKFVFGPIVENERERIGAKWKHNFPGFSVSIHTSEPIIQCRKLMTEEEIIAHQDFFEKCAQEYGKLAGQLIRRLIDTLKIPFTPEFPLVSLNAYHEKTYPTAGKMGKWRFRIHGFHCAFTHQSTEQHIEVPLTFGEEFGELDPYFFSNYILSSPAYAPLPISIFEPHRDGQRILEVMEELGKFEEIPSNIPGRTGIIVTDRDRKEIIVSEEGFRAVILQVIPSNHLSGFWQRLLRFWKR